MAEMFTKKYKDEFKFFAPSLLYNVANEYFSPLPGFKIIFRFEASYEHTERIFPTNVFKLKLVKFALADVSPTLEVSVRVAVYYSDGSLFEKYPYLHPTKVVKINDVNFDDVVRINSSGKLSAHSRRMASNTLVIKYSMIFSDQHQGLHIASANEIKSKKYIDIIGNLKSVYEASVLSDFVFKVGDRFFPAHKVILAAHSPVFMKMLTIESLESKTNKATITDATPEIFDIFLRYLYTGEIVDKSWVVMKEIYYLADKYDVKDLKTECAAVAISVLSIDLVCEILILVYNLGDLGLKAVATNFAVKHIKEIALREDWKKLVKTHPMIGYEVTANFIPK